MMKKHTIQKVGLYLGIATLSLLPLSVASTILYERDFSTDTNGATHEWFSSKAGTYLSISDGALVSSNNNGVSYALLYFAEAPDPMNPLDPPKVQLGIGETLSVSYTYSISGGIAGSAWMRPGLFNSTTSVQEGAAQRISGHNQGVSAAAYMGYTGYIGDYTSLRSTAGGNVRIFKRNGTKYNTNSDLGTSTSSNSAIYTGPHSTIPGFTHTNELEYTAVFEITNLGDRMFIELRGASSNGLDDFFHTSWDDTQLDAVSSFDTFVIMTSKEVDHLNIHDIKIEYIPEPSSTLPVMAALLFFGSAFSRRRKTA